MLYCNEDSIVVDRETEEFAAATRAISQLFVGPVSVYIDNALAIDNYRNPIYLWEDAKIVHTATREDGTPLVLQHPLGPYPAGTTIDEAISFDLERQLVQVTNRGRPEYGCLTAMFYRQVFGYQLSPSPETNEWGAMPDHLTCRWNECATDTLYRVPIGVSEVLYVCCNCVPWTLVNGDTPIQSLRMWEAAVPHTQSNANAPCYLRKEELVRWFIAPDNGEIQCGSVDDLHLDPHGDAPQGPTYVMWAEGTAVYDVPSCASNGEVKMMVFDFGRNLVELHVYDNMCPDFVKDSVSGALVKSYSYVVSCTIESLPAGESGEILALQPVASMRCAACKNPTHLLRKLTHIYNRRVMWCADCMPLFEHSTKRAHRGTAEYEDEYQ